VNKCIALYFVYSDGVLVNIITVLLVLWHPLSSKKGQWLRNWMSFLGPGKRQFGPVERAVHNLLSSGHIQNNGDVYCRSPLSKLN